MAKRYSKEYQEQAMSMLNEGGRSIREVSDLLGVSMWTVRSWKKNMKNPPEKPDESRVTKEELRRLRKENQDLKMENAVLKKFAAILSKEQN